jgi:alkylation response protein AidB-like acyl-CoA dehydrogenase
VSRTREELVALVAQLGSVMEQRAVVYDREASFPWENFHDFRERGLLGLCIPESHGGLGASFADYVRVSEEIGRHCGATALTFNMHVATMLWTGEVADLLDMTTDERSRHEVVRAELFRGVLEEGHIHSQPFSEGVSPGATSGVTTRAVPVEGGFLVTGRKIFASLSGAADFYNVTARVDDEDGARRTAGPTSPDNTDARRTAGPTSPDNTGIRFLGVPATAEGVRIEGTWDPLGMRGTVSRTLVMDAAFVPAANEWLPPGLYDQAAVRYPWLFMSLAPTYLGITRGLCDFTRRYLRGEQPGMTTGARRDSPQKQDGWAHMQIAYERSRALLFGAADRAVLDPGEDELVQAWAATFTAMETAPEVAALAVRVCGGQSMLRHLPLERMYRDARLGSLMLPWSAEVCLERLGRAHLY